MNLLVHPGKMIVVGFFLVLIGLLLPLFMVLGLLTSTFFLNFVAYIASFSGMILGMIGAVLYTRTHRRR